MQPKSLFHSISLACVFCCFIAFDSRGDGFLTTADREGRPLELKSQRVSVSIDGPAATTHVEQVYFNNSSRVLEAEYLFPLPKGASLKEFAMWVGGKKVKAETVPADKARATYEEIVRRLKDPGLLEYVGADLCKIRIYPIQPRSEQKIEISYLSVLKPDGGMYEYTYPLKSASTRDAGLGSLTLTVDVKSNSPLGPIHSPTHTVAVNRKGENSAIASFEQTKTLRDRDFQLLFSNKSTDTGFSIVAQKTSEGGDGYYLLLLSPKNQAPEKPIARDLVVVLDTSGSMAGEKINQAKGALRSALDSLQPADRFALVQFATVVGPYRDNLETASADNVKSAREWVEKLEAAGGTDIASALDAALRMKDRQGDPSRTFQLLFLTDGLPTIGVTDGVRILSDMLARNNNGVRVFCFGVGDDVDAHLLDQISENTHAASSYVRPGENLEIKVSSLLTKISHPVRTDLRLTLKDQNPSGGGSVHFSEMYPPKLPDLFAGEQLQLVGRYHGSGKVQIELEGKVGDRTVVETFDAEFPKIETSRDFVEQVWVRRKIGYLLDQIRLSGEKPETKDEVIRLATRYGIATPYTSHLVVPDQRVAHIGGGGLAAGAPSPSVTALEGRLHRLEQRSASAAMNGRALDEMRSEVAVARKRAGGQPPASRSAGRQKHEALESERADFAAGAAVDKPAESAQGGFPGGSESKAALSLERSGARAVDTAETLARMKSAQVVAPTSVKTIAGKRFEEFEGVWIDASYEAKKHTQIIKVKAFSDAYFAILKAHPELKDVFALGDRVVWVSPTDKVLIIDDGGKDALSEKEISELFAK